MEFNTTPDGATRLLIETRWTATNDTTITAIMRRSAYEGRGASLIPQFIPTLTYTVRSRNDKFGIAVPLTTVTAVGSQRWLQQLLAQANYLPYSYVPATAFVTPASTPVDGTFVKRFPKLPATLYALWQAGAPNVITKGAVMKVQDEHRAQPTGIVTAYVWKTLMMKVNARKGTLSSYNYVDVVSTLPQTLTLYQNGRVKSIVRVNLGISVAPTQLQTDPVYLRLESQTMTGLNPDGTRYVDPGVPWISYFNGGEALHGFIRPSYGSPQSLGCVELSFDNAKKIWPFTPIGTLVTVR
jgi:lipoprotein-anchoring transpeptidase ErfK/SrfK